MLLVTRNEQDSVLVTIGEHPCSRNFAVVITAGRMLGNVQHVIGSGSRRASGHTQTVTLSGGFRRLRLISE